MERREIASSPAFDTLTLAPTLFFPGYGPGTPYSFPFGTPVEETYAHLYHQLDVFGRVRICGTCKKRCRIGQKKGTRRQFLIRRVTPSRSMGKSLRRTSTARMEERWGLRLRRSNPRG